MTSFKRFSTILLLIFATLWPNFVFADSEVELMSQSEVERQLTLENKLLNEYETARTNMLNLASDFYAWVKNLNSAESNSDQNKQIFLSFIKNRYIAVSRFNILSEEINLEATKTTSSDKFKRTVQINQMTNAIYSSFLTHSLANELYNSKISFSP